MEELREEDILNELDSISFPMEENGWSIDCQSDLPPYRDLRRSLFAAGIKPELTWNKEDCIKALESKGDVQESNLSDNGSNMLFSELNKMMDHENNLIKSVNETSKILLPRVEDKFKGKEQSLIKKQLMMMQ